MRAYLSFRERAVLASREYARESGHSGSRRDWALVFFFQRERKPGWGLETQQREKGRGAGRDARGREGLGLFLSRLRSSGLLRALFLGRPFVSFWLVANVCSSRSCTLNRHFLVWAPKKKIKSRERSWVSTLVYTWSLSLHLSLSLGPSRVGRKPWTVPSFHAREVIPSPTLTPPNNHRPSPLVVVACLFSLSPHPSKKKNAVLGPPVFHPQQPVYTVAALPPGGAHPHHHPHNPYEVAALPTAQMQQLVVAQQAEEMRKNAKRAANRRSASTCRQRRKFLVENMADANNRMRKRARVLSLLPDMILAMRRDGVITYASENCSHFLQFAREVSFVPSFFFVLFFLSSACFFSESQVRMSTHVYSSIGSRACLFALRFKLGATAAISPRFCVAVLAPLRLRQSRALANLGSTPVAPRLFVSGAIPRWPRSHAVSFGSLT